jgi:hypothetical protein
MFLSSSLIGDDKKPRKHPEHTQPSIESSLEKSVDIAG